MTWLKDSNTHCGGKRPDNNNSAVKPVPTGEFTGLLADGWMPQQVGELTGAHRNVEIRHIDAAGREFITRVSSSLLHVVSHTHWREISQPWAQLPRNEVRWLAVVSGRQEML